MNGDSPGWRILNAEPSRYSPQAAALLQPLGELVERPLSRRELLAQIGQFEVLIVRLGLQIDREVMDAGTRLKAIVTATTGLDHIDVAAAQERGIAVLSLRGETAFLRSVTATPELTWALLLALARHLPRAVAATRAGDWDREAFRGHDLAGRRLGLVGLGRVGQRVAQYAQAFELPVAAYDPYLVEWPEGIARRTTLAELLREAEVLSLHPLLTPETENMMHAEALAQLPRGAWLINTARGELVDEAALVAALESGQLGGAALDVVRSERDPERRLASPLLPYARSHSNLILTPHVGGATFESMERTEIFMAEKLVRVLSHLPAPERG